MTMMNAKLNLKKTNEKMVMKNSKLIFKSWFMDLKSEKQLDTRKWKLNMGHGT